MNEHSPANGFGSVSADRTLTIQRVLPGPIERVWPYLTDSNLRRSWLAAGEMDLKVGASFEWVWRNDELSDSPASRPAGFPEEQRMQSRIIEIDPPRKLVIAWGASGDVTFELAPRGSNVVLTLVHRGLADRETVLMIGGGWHMHLDILTARASGSKPRSFWEGWGHLRDEYDRRLPA